MTLADCLIGSSKMEINDNRVEYIGASSLQDQQSMFVYWILGLYCNYRCSYCPEFLHSGSKADFPSKDVIISTLSKFSKNTMVMFGGGEPTVHPEFEQIVKSTPEGIWLGVLSNGSMPLKFWKTVSNRLQNIILTFHPEHSSLDKFIEVAEYIYIQSKIFGRVNLPMHPGTWDTSLAAYQRLADIGIPVTPKPLIENFGRKNLSQKLGGYTKEQLSFIETHNNNFQKTVKFYNKAHEVIHETSPSEMLSKNNTNFKGWTCHTPMTNREIRSNGDVYDMICNQAAFKGNIYTGFDLESEPVVCNQSMCWCHSDIMGIKIKTTN